MRSGHVDTVPEHIQGKEPKTSGGAINKRSPTTKDSATGQLVVVKGRLAVKRKK